MGPQTIANCFLADGCAIIPDVFTTREIKDIEIQLHAYVEDTVPQLTPGDVYFEDSPAQALKAMHNMDRHSEFFRALMDDPRLVAIVAAIWPKGSIIPASVMYFGKPAFDGSETPPHQDNAFQCLVPPDALTATIAIDASSNENGVLICNVGSHCLGLLGHRTSGVMGFSRCLAETIDEVQHPPRKMQMRPGDVALHHCNTVHGSGANRTAAARRQLGIGYRSSLAQRDDLLWTQYQQDLESLHNSRKVVAAPSGMP